MVWTVKDLVIVSSAIGCVVMIIAIVISFLCEFHMEKKIERETDKALHCIRYATNCFMEVTDKTIEKTTDAIREAMLKSIE